jgi:hypothetical protein
LWRALRPGGRLLLSVPFETSGYEENRLNALLAGWKRLETLFGIHTEGVWSVTAAPTDAIRGEAAVALIVAEKP